MDLWLTSEDFPDPSKSVTLDSASNIVLVLFENNLQAQRRLATKLKQMLDAIDCHQHLFDRSLYRGKDIPIGGTAHQNGIIRFGRGPATSALDIDGKAHEIDHLYVGDASFSFPVERSILRSRTWQMRCGTPIGFASAGAVRCSASLVCRLRWRSNSLRAWPPLCALEISDSVH